MVLNIILVARWRGVHVERFSTVGFGRAVWTRTDKRGRGMAGRLDGGYEDASMEHVGEAEPDPATYRPGEAFP